MHPTDAQRLAQAEAAASRWFRVLESMAGTTASDEVFSVHRRWLAAERAVLLHRALAWPRSRPPIGADGPGRRRCPRLTTAATP